MVRRDGASVRKPGPEVMGGAGAGGAARLGALSVAPPEAGGGQAREYDGAAASDGRGGIGRGGPRGVMGAAGRIAARVPEADPRGWWGQTVISMRLPSASRKAVS